MKLTSIFIVVASLFYFMMGFATQSINSALPAIAVELEMNHSMTGLVLGLPSLLYQVAVIVAAALSRKSGPFLSASLGISCITFSVIFMALSRTYYTFLIGRLLFGFGLGATEISIALGVSQLAFKRTGGVLNSVYSFFALGSIVAPLVVSAVLTETNMWNVPILIAAALFLVVVFLSWTVWKKAAKESLSDVEKRRITLPRDSMFWLVAAGGLLYVGYEVGLFSWLSSFAYEEKLLPLRMASLTTSILALGLFVGRIVTGVVVDKFGLQRTLVVLGTISLAGFSIAFFAGNSILLSLGVFITGLGFSGTFPTLQAIIVSGYRQNRETVLAIFAAAGSVGAVTTNILVGGVSDRTNLAYGMSVIGVQIAAALLIFTSIYLIQRKRKKLATP